MALRFSLLLIFSLLAVVSARPGHPFHPCNTLIISTYSFSLLPQNPNSLSSDHPDFIAVVDLYRHRFFRPRYARPHFSVNYQPQQQQQQQQKLGLGFEKNYYPQFRDVGFSSFKDRTKDILSVVASLLFGAACGALTAGTMYLIWSLFNHHNGNGSYRSIDGFVSDDDGNDDDDDIFNPKKKGYVAIPAAPATSTDTPVAVSAVVAAAPVKESA